MIFRRWHYTPKIFELESLYTVNQEKILFRASLLACLAFPLNERIKESCLLRFITKSNNKSKM